MIDLLKQNYNMEIEKYVEYGDGIVFYFNGDYFYFCKCYLSLNNLELLNKNIPFLIRKNIKLHSFIYNKKMELLTDGYLLMRINTIISKIDIFDIRKFYSVRMDNLANEYLFMDKIWEQKIDYLEIQIKELTNNKLIINSFDYFAGVVELIIKFIKKEYNQKETRLVLSHRLLTSLNTIDFYNPILLTYDHQYKDLSTFIRRNNDLDLLGKVLDNMDPNNKKYIFARMIFPFEYFEEVENVILLNKSENRVLEIISNIDKYENYVGTMQKFFNIKLFKWIKN